jgi:hypothetical protein
MLWLACTASRSISSGYLNLPLVLPASVDGGPRLLISSILDALGVGVATRMVLSGRLIGWRRNRHIIIAEIPMKKQTEAATMPPIAPPDKWCPDDVDVVEVCSVGFVEEEAAGGGVVNDTSKVLEIPLVNGRLVDSLLDEFGVKTTELVNGIDVVAVVEGTSLEIDAWTPQSIPIVRASSARVVLKGSRHVAHAPMASAPALATILQAHVTLLPQLAVDCTHEHTSRQELSWRATTRLLKLSLESNRDEMLSEVVRWE